jgi:leucyl-tRNA synthetase
MEYDFRAIEKKWRKNWAQNKTFAAGDDQSKPKYYVLDMFPYPSGAGLHVGHPLGYIASDIFSRYKRLQGFNVLHPMGYDSFGLPAEQYAIQTGQHPALTTEQNIARYRDQLDKIGFSFDWDREVRTSDPNYYRWTQWIFIQLFNSWYNPRSNKAEKIETLVAIFEKEGFNGNNHDILTGDIEKDLLPFTAGEWKNFDEKKQHEVLMNFRLTYLGEAYVNWCPELGTVLANDEVKDGFSERGGHPVERKLMRQWSMRITAYAQRLLDGLDTIDWPESLKDQQRNWIGRSEGALLRFKILSTALSGKERGWEIEVFTTRPDTIFGVSFVTLAPEHELVPQVTTAAQKAAVEEYVNKAKNRSERERMADVNTISGVFTGTYVEHPFTGKQIPIWVGDYVLAGYGTGAVMAVPAHDERDHKFAKHFGLNCEQVITPAQEHDFEKEAWSEKEGTLINSDFLNGLNVKSAIKKAIDEIDKKGFGKRQVNYRLRDAVFGRQRYWGEPIPVFYKDGTPYVLPENELPLTLPEVDKYLPTEDGEPPLARANNWKYKNEFAYEHSTMPGWAGSSWYFLRYMDPKNKTVFADPEKMKYWGQVDLYIGGSEHATGHLLYSRFWNKFLFDLGYISFDEPFKKLINQGMILGNSAYVYIVQPQRHIEIPPAVSAREIETYFSKIETKYKGADIAGKRVLLIPEEIYEQIKSTGKSQEVDDWFKREFGHFGPEITVTYEQGNVIKRAIDISLPEGDKLKDLNALRSWHRQFEFATTLYPGDYTCAREVEKMSKSKFNVQTPDELVEKFGADTLRLYEMFLGPLEQAKPWDTQGITGVHNFLRRFWRLFHNDKNEFSVSDGEPDKASLKTLHKTIKKIQDDLERFSFNTGVSNFMIATNEFTDQKCNNRSVLREMVILLSSYAPHIAEELWEKLGEKGSVTYAPFPKFNPEFLVESAFEYPVSFNGKMRFKVELPLALDVAAIEKEIMANDQTAKYLEGKTPKKVIIVHGKIVNVVV